MRYTITTQSRLIWMLLLGVFVVEVSAWGAIQFSRIRNYASNPLCPDNSATCRWTSQGEGISYAVTIYDLTSDSSVREVQTSQPWVRFTPLVGHRYRCSVRAINSCGSGPEESRERVCGEEAPVTPTILVRPTSAFLKTRQVSPDPLKVSSTPEPVQEVIPELNVVESIEETHVPWWKDLQQITTWMVYFGGVLFIVSVMLAFSQLFTKKQR